MCVFGSQLSEEQAQVLLERRAVVALSIPLFTRNIWKNNFLQAALGAELRLQGCSGSALDALNTMGLCQNKDTVRLLLQRLRNGKKPVSVFIGKPTNLPFLVHATISHGRSTTLNICLACLVQATPTTFRIGGKSLSLTTSNLEKFLD